jgi:hypothetical protein
VFFTRSVPLCYKQGQLDVAVSQLVGKLVSESEDCWGSVVVTCCCEQLVAEARGQLGNPGEGERPPLKAATKQRQ